MEDGSCIPHFGQKADQICNSVSFQSELNSFKFTGFYFSLILGLQALERFSQEAPLPSDDDNKENELIYDKKVEDLEKFLDAPLHVIYLKQLSILREKSLKTFKQALTSEGTEFEAMMQADEFYRKVRATSNYKSKKQ